MSGFSRRPNWASTSVSPSSGAICSSKFTSGIEAAMFSRTVPKSLPLRAGATSVSKRCHWSPSKSVGTSATANASRGM